MEILEKVKLLLDTTGINSEMILTMLVEEATTEAVNYCNLKEYNIKLDPVITKMVIQNYNKSRVQGVSSEAFSGVTQAYTDGYTKDVIMMLNKNRKVKTL